MQLHGPPDFDEEAYLSLNPDVNEAVQSGAIKSGLWHYLQHGHIEKRSYIRKPIDPVTDTSPVWKAFKRCAPFHDKIDDFTLFHEMMDKVKRKENFHVARYNDGEWVFMLRIEPYYTTYITQHRHNQVEVEEISTKLLNIIRRGPQYYIGIDSTTKALQGTIAKKRDHYKKEIANLPNIIFGDIFNAATIRFGIEALKDPLKHRYCISVGAPFMKKLGMNYHLSVPPLNCWNRAKEVEGNLHKILKNRLDKNPVIVYSCSLLAKLLIDNCYQRYGNQITQLDIGSCIDPWCGIISRPWHADLAKHYNIQAAADPNYYCV